MNSLTQITEKKEEKMNKALAMRYYREQEERKAAQIEAGFMYWTGIVAFGLIAAIGIAVYIIKTGGK